MTLLFEKRLDPFAPIARRLDVLSCERRRLRPAWPLLSGRAPEIAPIRDAARSFAERIGGRCRAAFLDLVDGSSTPESRPPVD